MKNTNETSLQNFLSPEHETHVNLVRTARQANLLLESRLKQFDLDLSLFGILRIIHLRTEKFINIKEIQQGMMHKMANTSRLIRVLEERELITRKPSRDDKRVVNVNLTEKGVFVMDELDDMTNEFYINEFSDFSKKELSTFNDMLGKLRHDS